MPYRNYDKRVRNYDLAVIPDVVRSKFEARKPAMLDGQEEYQKTLTDVEIAVRGILDDEGVVANMRVMYLNFARTLVRASGHQSGVALQKIAAAEKAKFTTYGLDPSILDKIVKMVIGMVAYGS